jgi:hypothetical protein
MSGPGIGRNPAGGIAPQIRRRIEKCRVYAIDVFALHDKAKRFYLKYGFVEMLDQPLHLFLPIATARRLAKIAGE